MKAVWVANQEGQGVPYVEQELRCILSSRLEGLPQREGQWKQDTIVRKGVTPFTVRVTPRRQRAFLV